MKDFTQENLQVFFREKLRGAKVNFERALDCKHTDFDDLYPYMNEQPQFFWYKRYVAWSELLTVVRLAEELGIEWKDEFNEQQVEFITGKVLQGKVLDQWHPETEPEETLSNVEE
ncbi:MULTISPECIES: hypothetical protein [Brevibacillus]|jgi:hypothetical protein|uniref:Uncharacterized protein n=1 Tax=Brevibacillus borstelensis AK1 TaxID=1300222 RepID=M8E9A0_9BACL|nr:hypothetical protein [Brevibacillus borstelensis]EMT52050.1 hypothetical protein I532_14443 [Brevibacillus borstelensis AK1]KKX53571.1 hypothetical protein X546_19525 [Brevibacillus borstelensis cifa_chp40]MBE5394033.1 hypothetical protein [Brevibacillus borstelensis]MCC0566987.1 hypothetical protein [Brevibacillus borstelensis]MCM3468935.1 hypothetical protein [Brevibacillus borstelensis]